MKTRTIVVATGPGATNMAQNIIGALISVVQAQTRGSAVGYRFLNFMPIKDPTATPTKPAEPATKPTTDDTLE